MGSEYISASNSYHKWISVGTFKEILAQLNDDDELTVNQVGNLSVFRGNEAAGFDQIGYIDIGGESLELKDDPPALGVSVSDGTQLRDQLGG